MELLKFSHQFIRNINSPSSQISRIETQRTLKLQNRLLMFTTNAVVVANDAACLRPILVDFNSFVSQICHLSFLLAHEQQVRVDVEIVESIWILVHDDFKDFDGFFYLALVVIGNSDF